MSDNSPILCGKTGPRGSVTPATYRGFHRRHLNVCHVTRVIDLKLQIDCRKFGLNISRKALSNDLHCYY